MTGHRVAATGNNKRELLENCDRLENSLKRRIAEINTDIAHAASFLFDLPDIIEMVDATKEKVVTFDEIQSLGGLIARDVDLFKSQINQVVKVLEATIAARPVKPSHMARYYSVDLWQVNVSLGEITTVMADTLLKTVAQLGEAVTKMQSLNQQISE